MQPLTGPLDSQACAELSAVANAPQVIGHSEQGHAVHGLRVGDPSLPLVSIVAGAHPDEPAGPVAALELLRHWPSNPLATQVQLAVVPVIDVDGIIAQRSWLAPWHGAIDLPRYLEHRMRRLPGADREFAWPGAPWDPHGASVLPECAAAASFLDSAGPAIAHLSLHGMFTALGPWYLLNRPALADRRLWAELQHSAADLGLPVHEFHRYGDKGFRRCGRGFCTAPSGPAMRRFFLQAGDPTTARSFGYGSMDAATARARAARRPEPLVAISEFPLLQLPETEPNRLSAGKRELETQCANGNYQAAADTFLALGARPLPLATQVAGMLAMVKAVIHAALRQRS
ncbi:MAG: hypothetical protein PF961_20595 [Planctomycetota bacterium]|jgi:hypothetical protein|nr:hypothetical protein [Planctomycetota bacterium]